ncbi:MULTISPECIES: YokU family protein [Neobacillus]|uniref:YokU family protein n=1 Tax=Neobacillus rhizophilus TaxID=2833579 RepID=A0A942U795_9BACI|nr:MULTISPECIES: YokU family protein [Neobacillus]MBS4215991.1 YokU family protein [Neobacillus rhizophilus]MBU8916112.1 YokU family protein [Bacillus sp. FJAT-29953]
MVLVCEWCSSENVKSVSGTVYWELPDGSRAIEITETPAFDCPDCSMVYQSEATIKEIEDQLFLIDSKKVGKIITFKELMSIPRLLKRNYFDFS